jgi:hypothetical protein
MGQPWSGHAKSLGQERFFFFVELTEFGRWFHGDTEIVAEKRVQGFEPENLTRKDSPKVAGDGMCDFLQRQQLAQFFCNRCHWLGCDAAGDDQTEIIQIGIHVKCKAMRSDPTRNVHANGCDLGLFPAFFMLRICPHAGETGNSLRRNAESGASANQNFFEFSHIFNCTQSLAAGLVRRKSPQIEDGIANQLSRAMKRNIPSAIRFKDLNAALGEELGRRENVFLFGITTESNHRRVLKQQENIANAPIFAQIDKLLLQPQGGRVIKRAELEKRDQNRYQALIASP